MSVWNSSFFQGGGGGGGYGPSGGKISCVDVLTIQTQRNVVTEFSEFYMKIEYAEYIVIILSDNYHFTHQSVPFIVLEQPSHPNVHTRAARDKG